MNQKMTLKEMVLTGVMAASVFVASAFLQLPIPTAIGSTRLHMGNVMCLLAGLLLGPVQGGLAAGIGSLFFDLTNPAYAASAPFTFVFKFTMAWLCGKTALGKKGFRKRKYFLGAILGAAAYIVLYLSKSFAEHYFVLGMPMEAVLLTISQKAAVSCINGAVAVLVAVPAALALEPAIRKIMPDLRRR